MQMYHYEGPVMEFDRIIADKWISDTYAATEKKALSNLTFQYKKKYGKAPHAKIKLPGKLTPVN